MQTTKPNHQKIAFNNLSTLETELDAREVFVEPPHQGRANARGLDSSVGSGFAPWPRGRGFETQPSTVRAPTGWVGVSIM
ncbi:hypothetical protein ElyMa_001211800 [Elysia marginata]|uniref:Uncharacterized protein n=1 Tax=Elysia marginata TaxID=1093978 RepID=A0AAV4I6G9_9GAST|nr:hypothetical protein ElyMa_001211800 [Elysia marginata]